MDVLLQQVTTLVLLVKEEAGTAPSDLVLGFSFSAGE